MRDSTREGSQEGDTEVAGRRTVLIHEHRAGTHGRVHAQWYGEESIRWKDSPDRARPLADRATRIQTLDGPSATGTGTTGCQLAVDSERVQGSSGSRPVLLRSWNRTLEPGVTHSDRPGLDPRRFFLWVLDHGWPAYASMSVITSPRSMSRRLRPGTSRRRLSRPSRCSTVACRSVT